MRYITGFIVALALVLSLARCVQRDVNVVEVAWSTSYTEVTANAQESGRPILALFTGSDWCPPCKQLEANVLSKDAFKQWARDNVELLYIDFPQGKPQSEEQKSANRALQARYEISGYPTVVFMTAEGEVISSQSGYGGMPLDAWIADAEQKLEGHIRPNLKLTTDLATAVRSANSDKLRNLLVIHADEQAYEHLIHNAAIVALAKQRLIVAADSAKSLLANLPDAREDAAATLIDMSGPKPALLAQMDDLADVDALVTAIKQALPRLEYEAGTWLTELDFAKAVAEQEDKPLLIDFTISDLADDAAAQMRKEVLETDTFKDHAAEHYVLMRVDFPQLRELPPATFQTRLSYAMAYGVQGLPSYVITSADGKQHHLIAGYQQGGPEAFIKQLNTAVAKMK